MILSQLAYRKSKIKMKTESLLLRCVTDRQGMQKHKTTRTHKPSLASSLQTDNHYAFRLMILQCACPSVWDVSEWVSDQSAALDEIPAVCAPLMTRLNDGPHLKQRWAIKRNGVGRRILVVLTDITEWGGRGNLPSLTASFYFLLSARERRWYHKVIAVHYSSRKAQINSDFYTIEGQGLIKDTLINKQFRTIYCLAISSCSWSRKKSDSWMTTAAKGRQICCSKAEKICCMPRRVKAKLSLCRRQKHMAEWRYSTTHS